MPSRALARSVSADPAEDALEFPLVKDGVRLMDVAESTSLSDRAGTAKEVRWPVLRGYMESYILMFPPPLADRQRRPASRPTKPGFDMVSAAQVLRGVSNGTSRYPAGL